MSRLFGLEDLCGSYLHEDWLSESASPYEAAEGFMIGTEVSDLVALIADIDALMLLPTEAGRFESMPQEGFCNRPAGYVDAWLIAVRRRAQQALLGNHSEPLTDPDGPTYDLEPPWSGGLLHGEEADEVLAQVLRAHRDYLSRLERDGGSRSIVMRTQVGGSRTVVNRDTDEVLAAPIGCVVQHWFRPRLHGTTVFVEPPRPPAPAGFPVLELFFSSYLRPGWWDVYDNPMEGVAPFRREQGPALTAAALVELERLQDLGDESDRRQALHLLGSYLVPRREGETDTMLWALGIWLTQPGVDR